MFNVLRVGKETGEEVIQTEDRATERKWNFFGGVALGFLAGLVFIPAIRIGAFLWVETLKIWVVFNVR